MNILKDFLVPPGSSVHLEEFDTDRRGKRDSKSSAHSTIRKLQQRMDALQFRLYAEGRRSLLICLQALDAGGKDGVIRHVVSSMSPQGCRVVGFKQPSAEELAHDFLWRIECATPKRGEAVIFNRSHYEDVLVVRVHDLVPKQVWSQRYDQINDFERRLAANGTRILKFFLHIGKEEQLKRFKDRLDDPERRWKISEADYTEREYWDAYEAAYEDAIGKCSTDEAPWYVIPSDRKWFRDLAISTIIVDALEKLGLELPPPGVDIDTIRREYHQAIGRSVGSRSGKND
jgi:PPK2 family polyphosphate:nucleotide phosphotransferase